MKGMRQDRSYLQLVLGIVFIGYGSYRLYTFFHGTFPPVYRIIVVGGILLFGAWDLYKFFRPRNRK